jgi:hypothetical protein
MHCEICHSSLDDNEEIIMSTINKKAMIMCIKCAKEKGILIPSENIYLCR